MFGRKKPEISDVAVAPETPRSPTPIPGIKEISDTVGYTTIRVQEFFDDSTFLSEKIERLQELISEKEILAGLLEKAGLETAAREARGHEAFYRYCLKRHLDPENVELENELLVRDFGAPLRNEQIKILLTLFPVSYQWGFHPQLGDRETYHERKVGRGGIDQAWTWNVGGENITFRSADWKLFNLGTVPISVAAKIVKLQQNPVIHSLFILAPKESVVSDPLLIALSYKIGTRLIARWGEALDPIPGIDS